MLIAQRPSLAEEQVDEYRSRFVIEPLEPGFGYTLGNSLRRTLLSSIPGAAVTQVRFDDALHDARRVAELEPAHLVGRTEQQSDSRAVDELEGRQVEHE